MEERNFVCIECPRGCSLSVKSSGENVEVTGNFCPRGKKYATEEVTVPRRILTSTVRGENGMISVKTDGAIRKEKQFELMKIIRSVKVMNKLKIGDVIVKNIDNEGTNLIATEDYNN